MSDTVPNPRPVTDGGGYVERLSVQPEWCRTLPLQQQSVLLLAARGPDGVGKAHPCKAVVRAYRGTVLVAAARRRTLHWGEKADSFMSLDRFAEPMAWRNDVDAFFDSVDDLPHHYLMHLAHGAEIAGYKHPDERFRDRWLEFYFEVCADAHMTGESEAEMDARLNDQFGDERECDCMCHSLGDGLGMHHAVACCPMAGRRLSGQGGQRV